MESFHSSKITTVSHCHGAPKHVSVCRQPCLPVPTASDANTIPHQLMLQKGRKSAKRAVWVWMPVQVWSVAPRLDTIQCMQCCPAPCLSSLPPSRPGFRHRDPLFPPRPFCTHSVRRYAGSCRRRGAACLAFHQGAACPAFLPSFLPSEIILLVISPLCVPFLPRSSGFRHASHSHDYYLLVRRPRSSEGSLRRRGRVCLTLSNGHPVRPPSLFRICPFSFQERARNFDFNCPAELQSVSVLLLLPPP